MVTILTLPLDFLKTFGSVPNQRLLTKTKVKIRFLNHSISHYLYNALQIQPQKLVQITSHSYTTELQKK